MKHRLDEKLKYASSAYEKGYSCAQAVLGAYCEELGISESAAYRMMEGFSHGMGGSDGMCGVITAAAAVISSLNSEGKPGCDCSCTYNYIERIQKIFRREYGGITCKEILQGNDPAPLCCRMKVRDMILVIEQVISTMYRRKNI